MAEDTVTIRFDGESELQWTHYAICPCGHQTRLSGDPRLGFFFTCEGCNADYAFPDLEAVTR